MTASQGDEPQNPSGGRNAFPRRAIFSFIFGTAWRAIPTNPGQTLFPPRAFVLLMIR